MKYKIEITKYITTLCLKKGYHPTTNDNFNKIKVVGFQ